MEVTIISKVLSNNSHHSNTDNNNCDDRNLKRPELALLPDGLVGVRAGVLRLTEHL